MDHLKAIRLNGQTDKCRTHTHEAWLTFSLLPYQDVCLLHRGQKPLPDRPLRGFEANLGALQCESTCCVTTGVATHAVGNNTESPIT